MAPATLPTIAGNVSTAFPASLLRVSASFFTLFFKSPSFFGEDDPDAARPPCHPPQKKPVIVSTIVEMVIERAVSIDATVMPSSQNELRICSAKDLSSSNTFSSLCLILRTYI